MGVRSWRWLAVVGLAELAGCSGKQVITPQPLDSDTGAAALTCEVLTDTGGEIGVSADCRDGWEANHDPFAPSVFWQIDLGPGQYRSDLVADLDGDGVGDIAVVSAMSWQPQAWIFSGADGSELLDTNEFRGASPLVAMDGDGDGALELVGISPEGRVLALGVDGAERWRSEVITDTQSLSYPMIPADINGDGVPEVLTPDGAIEGGTGRRLAEFQPARNSADPQAIALGDADLDGQLDIFVNCSRFDAAGGVVWRRDCAASGIDIPMLVQADSDPEAEVLFVESYYATLYEPDGLEIGSFMTSTSGRSVSGQAPCAADLDGDGITEIVRGSYESDDDDIYAMRLDGTVLWSREGDGTTPLPGCSILDLDADGAPEILLSEPDSFTIVAGTTGEILYRDSARCGNSTGAYPMIADLDGDGSAEIIDVNLYSPYGGACDDPYTVRVYHHDEAGWPPASRIWSHGQNDGASQRGDGSVVALPTPWLASGIVRGQPAFTDVGSDLRIVLVDGCDACSDGGDGFTRLSVAVENLGPLDTEAATATIYTLDSVGAPIPYLTLDFGALVAGQRAAAQQVTVPSAAARLGLQIVAGEDCNAVDNAVDWTPACP